MKSSILCLPMAVLLMTGCADNLAKFYQPYQGVQKNWPTSPEGGYISTVRGVTFYHGQPPKPYTILGRYDRSHIPSERIAQSAKYHHASAVMLVEKDIEVTERDNGVTFGNARVSVTTPSTIRHRTEREGTAYLIQFTSTTNNIQNP